MIITILSRPVHVPVPSASSDEDSEESLELLLFFFFGFLGVPSWLVVRPSQSSIPSFSACVHGNFFLPSLPMRAPPC